MTRKIDLVYLWLDGNDQKWRAEKEKWQAIEEGRVPVVKDSVVEARWRDNDELKYSLRSAEMFAPWINHIYIVTCMGQVPSWLDTSNPKITIVDHTEIMPLDVLPTFNSIAIEACIVNIPNLSEYFLYANDDTFFGRPLGPSYFLMDDGRSIIWYGKYKLHKTYIDAIINSTSEYIKCLCYTERVFENIFDVNMLEARPSHNIDIYNKLNIKAFLNNPLIDIYYKKTLSRKFRNQFDLQRWIFSINDIVFEKAIAKRMRFKKKTKHFLYNFIHRKAIYNSPIYTTNAIVKNISGKRPPLFCVNDSEKNTPQDMKDNKEFLKSYFPNKSKFEK